MVKTRSYILCAAVVCLSGFLGLAQAHDTKTSAAPAAGSKALKSGKVSKTAKVAKKKSAKSYKIAKSSKTARQAPKSEAVATAQVPVAASPANPYLSYQNTNPYLTNQPVNPFFASQASNPYLAYRYEKPNSTAQATAAQDAMRPAAKPVVAQSSGISKISFAPMPMTMYLQPNQRPTMAITTPCSAMEKMTGNHPMFKAMEQMAFGMIGNMNEAGFMPMIIEPVCV